MPFVFVLMDDICLILVFLAMEAMLTFMNLLTHHLSPTSQSQFMETICSIRWDSVYNKTPPEGRRCPFPVYLSRDHSSERCTMVMR